jgi:hypothetical protein
LALKYQWSTAFKGFTSSTDGPLKLISIKPFKLCGVDDLKLFLTIVILLNPHSQATVDAGITESMDIILLTEELYHHWLELYLKACYIAYLSQGP